MSIRTKKCTAIDIPNLVAISIETYRNHYPYLWYDNGEQYIKDNFSTSLYEEQFTNEHAEFYLIYDDNEIIGMYKLLHLNIETLELERIYILKKATGKSVGKKMIAAIENYATAIGKKELILKTMDSSNAFEFYKKVGFEISKKIEFQRKHLIQKYKGMYLMVKKIE